MKLTLNQTGHVDNYTVAIVCPHCGHKGTFETLTNKDISVTRTVSGRVYVDYILGIRRCPNDLCKGQLFFIVDYDTTSIIQIHPSNLIHFNKDNIPDKVLNSFEEAVKCHSNSCYIASAIMIRKTLEVICLDRGATGKNLFQKLQDLGNKILIPKELLEAMDELRLLGNDAAHIEAETFEKIGKEEIEISIDFTKEILKAVYQYESLLSKLRNLKSVKPTN